ncbi:hypothetical protein GN958_ATG10951 [Phytophthora infestans]|uniref:Uncharacterized protein n=1 Tax=Phytophthora infestans TaxID=4787 RepID=A0A8S9UH26_PHYIN|nr:hypothetical protein GN958_ATG10951 [Phytophthora infestans]
MDFLSANKLKDLFTQQPGGPLWWPFAKTIDVGDGEFRFREHMAEQVAGFRLSDKDGVFEWNVSYLHSGVLYYQVQELFQGIIRAKDIGAI